MVQPPIDSLLGLQNIVVSKAVNNVPVDGGFGAGTVNTSVSYSYGSAFRIVKNLTLTNLSINPNAAARGRW